MNCRTSERWISDDLDGRLSPGRRGRLRLHCEHCPACRAFRADAAVLQKAARALPDPAPPEDYWGEFERRLRSGLAEAPRPSAGTRIAAFHPARRRAWAAAVLALLAAGGILLFRPRGTGEGGFPVYFRTPLQFDQAVGADAELAEAVNGLVLGSIGEDVRGDADIWLPRLAADPLFWEGLSDEDLKHIEAELRREIQRGG